MAATIFWSGNFIIARELNDSVAPVSLAFGRWLVAVLVLFPFAIKSLLSEWISVKEKGATFLFDFVNSLIGQRYIPQLVN